MKLRFRPAALSDLDGIWDYTADVWGAGQADLYILSLQTACKALAAGTRRGRDAGVGDGP